jgi:Pyridoxamine 5'-phosphate oxidase
VGREVEFSDVAVWVERFGPLATLVTVTDDGAPHVGTVTVDAADDQLTMRVGARTRENVLARPALTLAWLHPDRDYQLIIDGSGAVDGDRGSDGLFGCAVSVERGILHRLAGRADAGPSCRALAGAATTDEGGEAPCFANRLDEHGRV